MEDLREVITIHDGEEYIKDENDIFHLEKPSTWVFGTLAQALDSVTGPQNDEETSAAKEDIDYDKIIKRLIVHSGDIPTGKETPYFNHDAFYANLKYFAYQSDVQQITFGNILLYGDVVTSTNTMLEK